MQIPPFEIVDYNKEAIERVTDQFKGADVFQRYLLTLIDGYSDIQQCLKDLLQLRSISTARGAQLDIIGEIVGQPRELIEADLFTYFGFEGLLDAGSLGALGSAEGGLFYNLGDNLGGNILLNDDQYRMFIRAKIFKNSFTSTPEEFITAINQIFETTTTFISTDVGGYVVVYFGRDLTSFERVLINHTFYEGQYPVRLLPKTVGVRLDFGQYQAGEYFGFLGSPGAKGFGGLGPPPEYRRDIDCVTRDGDPIDYGYVYEQFTGVQDYGNVTSPADSEEDYNLDFLECFPVDGGTFAEIISNTI